MNMIEAVVLFTCDHILTLFGIEGILVTGNQPTLAMRRPKRKFKEGERTQRTSLAGAGGMTDEPKWETQVGGGRRVRRVRVRSYESYACRGK